MRESDEQKARRLVGEMLRKAGWSAEELNNRRKADPQKARLAARLRADTPMTRPWIAKRLENCRERCPQSLWGFRGDGEDAGREIDGSRGIDGDLMPNVPELIYPDAESAAESAMSAEAAAAAASA